MAACQLSAALSGSGQAWRLHAAAAKQHNNGVA